MVPSLLTQSTIQRDHLAQLKGSPVPPTMCTIPTVRAFFLGLGCSVSFYRNTLADGMPQGHPQDGILGQWMEKVGQSLSVDFPS